MTQSANRNRPQPRCEPQRGQMIVLFSLTLIAVLGMAGLLVDGGMAWVNRRQAQAAADTAALASGLAATVGANVTTAAQTIAAANGFNNAYTDCDGVARTNGVVVNRPPATGPNAGSVDYIEVVTTRPMRTSFAGAVGQTCWMVSARAVSSIRSQVATCNFCALSDWNSYSTLLLDNGSDLRVDGDIIVNQDDWYTGATAVDRCGGNDPCSVASCGSWNGYDRGWPYDNRVLMCGTSMYVDNTGGPFGSLLSAKTISINGGWQVWNHHDKVHADELAATCPAHPNYTAWPPAYESSNVCIGVPKIADPFNDPNNPLAFIPPPDPFSAPLNTCLGATYPCGPVESYTCKVPDGETGTLMLPTGTFTSPQRLDISGTSGTFYICPGLYFGGFSSNGDEISQPHIIMLPGTYFMVGGGFTVTGYSSIYGDGVMIYNSGGRESFSANTVSDPTLIPAPCVVVAGWACYDTGSPGPTLVTGSDVEVGVQATYTLTLTPSTSPVLPKPSGTAASFEFYDGQNLLDCEGGITISGTTDMVATCKMTYSQFGTRGITAVYLGDSNYAPAGDTATQTVNPPSDANAGNLNINTQLNASCPTTCGMVYLKAPTSPPYSGLLIFQDRADGIGIQISPAGSTLADCTGNWMGDGVPPNLQPVPAPCGALGGLNGTIYANHQSTGPSDWDAIVNIGASGVAKVQVIASQIHIVVDDVQARFTFNAADFANGKIHLVE